MPELSIELLSTGTSQTFTQAEVRLGRDPSCDVVFESADFPMVGRQHAVLRENGGAWSVEDLQSTNGTFVNHVRIQRHDLAPGDTLRLGSDGPEVRVQFIDERPMPSTRPAALAAAAAVGLTQPSAARLDDPPPARPAELNASPAPAAAQLAATKPSEPPSTWPAVPPTAPSVRPTKPSPAPYSAPATTIRTSQEAVVQPEVSPALAVHEQQAEISEQEEEDPMNEEKLNLLRNLVLVMVALVLVLVGIVISQTQDIRRDLRSLHDEAANALTQSKLNERMQGMETAVNGMDKKIQDAQKGFSDTMDKKMEEAQKKFDKDIHQSMSQEEDHLMKRVRQELPDILDQEIERQKRKILQ